MAGDEKLGPEDLKRCVFLARYRKIGVNQWIRVEKPEIETSDEVWPHAFLTPQLDSPNKERAEVRVRDDKAVDLTTESLLGDYKEAAERCDEVLRQKFQGDVIVDSLSEW